MSLRRRACFGLTTAFIALALLLAACGPPPAPPSPTPPPAPSPTAAPTPSPTPTLTPPAPVSIHVEWPALVNGLQDFTLRVRLEGIEERDPETRVWAWIMDDRYRLQWMDDLQPVGNGEYVAPTSLHIPMEVRPGDWQLTVSILSQAALSGERALTFRARPVPLRELDGGIRPNIVLRIPLAMIANYAEGDAVAGGRTWTGPPGEVGLWWVPGPVEPLRVDTAQMLVEATYPQAAPPEILAAEAAEWHGLEAVRFYEQWPEGPAEALVVRGSDLWLYLLRVRSTHGSPISPLLQDIAASLQIE
ncbi:MAG: hypothetical protein JW900_08565 [Anaerolineae bacterium]|nr:hypothetical protein [Anaerolineae bacterium]